MTDTTRVIRTMREIELILAEHTQPGHKQNCEETINRILEAMDKPGVQESVERLSGRSRPRRI
jgi:hypothetical protein